MKFVHLDLTLGEDWQVPIEFNKADDSDLDVTGAQDVTWYLKGAGYDTNVYMTRTIGNGITLGSSGAGGIVSALLIIPPEAQMLMDPMPAKGQYRHELSVKLGNGVTSIQGGGPVSLRESLRWNAALSGDLGGLIPENVVTLGGEVLMFGEEFLTLGG